MNERPRHRGAAGEDAVLTAGPVDDISATLTGLAASIAAAFPDLPAAPPLTVIAMGPDNLVVESAGGVIVRVPRHAAAGEARQCEERLLPFLQGHVPVALPVPEWQTPPSAAFPWGWAGYRKAPGRPLRPEAIHDRNVDRLAGEIAAFLAALHQFPMDRAQALGVPGPRAWKERQEALRRRSLPILRPRLRPSEMSRVRRWWEEFLADPRNWSAAPALVHGDFQAEHLLVDIDATTLTGVLDFGAVIIGDAAVDFAGVVQSYGTDFGWRVVEAYGRHGGDVDAPLLLRIRRLGAVWPFALARRAAQQEDDAAQEEAVAALRRGPILGEASGD